MKNALTLLALVACILLGSVAQSNATVITFDAMENTGEAAYFGASYFESGFTFTKVVDGFEFGSWGTSSDLYAGSAMLFSDSIGENITLTSSSPAFSVLSLDIAELAGYSEDYTVTFYGLTATGETVSMDYTLDGVFGAETVTFTSQFTNLVSFSWAQDGWLNMVDNVEVSAVPEPATFALMGLGFAGLGLLSRFNRKA